MFCKQNAYTPKSLDSSSILQRIHTKTGTAARKLISKQDFLQPYFDGEFSDVHSSRIAQNIERYIKITKKYQRETKFFVEAVLNRIYLLHKYNLKVAEVTFKYPLSPNFTQLLLRYVVLECSVLYKREHHTPRYEATVQERILRLLQNVYKSYLETLIGVPPEKLLNERCTAILNLFIKIKSEFEVQNDLMENIAKKLLKKMGRLEQVNALKKKCIPCPLDTFLSDPAVVNSYKNIITSDYGTDDDLKIEEEIIQVDPQNEDDDSNEEPDIKQDISEILRVSNGLHQVPATNSQVKKVPTIYIDDDNEEMIVLEEEIETSSKSARRQRAEEEKKLFLREKQYEMFSNHKPFDDIKPYVKDEVIDLDSDEESGTTESCVNETNTRVAVEVVVIDDDADSTAVQPPIAWDSPKVIKKLNEEDILELSSDEDESPKVIPKEEEEELLKDETDDQANRSPQAVGDSNISNTAIHKFEHTVHSNTFDINTSGFSQEENNISVDNSTEPSNMPYPSLTDTLISSSEETLATQRENVSIEEQPSNDSAAGIQQGIKLELDTPKDNPDNQERADIESEKKLTCDELQTVAAHRESTENSENTSIGNEIVKNETENVTEENIDLNMENGKTLNGEPEPKSDELHVIKSVEDPSKSLLEKNPVNEAGTSIKPKGIQTNSLLTEGKCPPLSNEENLVSQCKNIEQNEIEDLKSSLLDQREDDENTSMEQKKANDSDNILEASEVEEALLENENIDTRLTVSHSLEVAELSDNIENVNVTCNRVPSGVIDDTTAAESTVSSTDEAKDEPVSSRGESMNWDEKNDDLRENESLDQSNTDTETVNETQTKAAGDQAEEDTSSIDMSHSKEQTPSNMVQVQEEIVGKRTEVDVDQENSGNIENQNVAENETITEANVEPDTKRLEEGNVNTHFEDAEIIDRKNPGNENLDRVNETGSVSDETESGTKELSKVSEGEGTSEDRHKELPEGNKVSEECSDAGDNTTSDQPFKPSSNEVEELNEGMEEIIEGSEDVEDAVVEAPNNEIIDKEVEQITEEPTENFLDKKIVDDIENAVVDARGSEIKEIKEVEQIIGEPTENFLDKKIVDDIEDAVVDAPSSEIIDKEAELITEEPTENFLDKKIVDDIEDAVVDAPSSEIIDKEAELITEEPTKNFLDKKIVDDIEDAVVDAPSSEIKEIKEVEQIIGEPAENFLDKEIVDDIEDAVVDASSSNIKEVEQIIGEPTENFLDKKIVDDSEDAVVDAPSSEIKEVKQIIGETMENFLDNKIVDDSEDAVVEAPSSEIIDKEAELLTEEPTENFLDKKIVDDSEDVVVDTPSSEIKEVEQIIGEPTENFLVKTTVDDVVDAVNDTTNDHTESTLTEEGLNLQTNEENIEMQEVFQFRNTEHEIVITAEDVGHFELIEQEVPKTNDIPTEEQYGNEKITKEVEGFPENAYVGPTSHETEIIHFEMAKSVEPNFTEEICYGKYNESTLVDDLNIQKEEIITEVHTLDLGIPEEFVINGSHSQIVPAPIEVELPLMKAEKIEKGNTVTNNQIIPKQVGQHLEICGIPDDNTYLDILATVATEMSRQDLLKKKKAHNERRKKQFNLKAKIERVQGRRNSKIKSKVEKRVTRSALTKKKTEMYLEPKCKPHDFVFTNDSGVPPPSNNIYTQKLSEIPLTSEDSNDSEGILLIDEDIDVKSNKPNLPRMKKLSCYDEDTMEENIIFRYEPKVQGTVLISIPDTYQGNFEFLTQIEQLDNCSSHPFANVPNSQNDIFPEEKTYFGDLPSSKNSQKPENSILEKKNHKPFRTKAEQKDYDKFSLKPYVSIERLNITTKKEEKHKHGRSKSFETGITTDKSTVCEVNNDVLKNEPTEVFKDEINNLPTKIKAESNTDETNREDSDDDIPLLQRTLFELKQTKKLVTSPKSLPETKKGKLDQKTSFDKTTKVKSGVKSKTKPKKTHVNVKDDAKRLPKKLINEEKTTNTSSPNDIPATANLPRTSVHPTVPLANTVKNDICPTSSEPETDKNNTNEPVPKSNQQIKSDRPSYEEFMKSSNTKYYTTPKLRRKSVSKHNLNRNDIKFEGTKQVIFNADKKYYTPPKLRRKSMAENENGTDTKKITPKQLKVSTSKVDILSKCKNTISPTTEKLKKKLEIDFKLNCTELSAEETRENGDGDHIPSQEIANSDVTETTPVDSPEIENQLIRDVNDTNKIPDVSEQNIHEKETDKDLPVTQTNISETTECELNTNPENSQGPDTLTDRKESKPSNETEEILTVASKFTPPTIENPTEDIQEAEVEICKTKTVDVSKTQSDSEMNKIQDSASNQSGTGAIENVEGTSTSGSSVTVDKLIENEENLDDLPLSKRTSMSSHHVLKEPEFKTEMKPHRKSLKKTASDIESNFETENKKQQNIPKTDTDNIKIGLENETIPKFKTKRTKEPQKHIPNEIKLPEQGSCTKKDNELTKSEGKTKSQKVSKVKSGKLSKKHKNKIENNKKETSETKTGLSGESPKKVNDKTENVGLDIKNKNISSRLIESINLKEMSEEPIDISANKEQIEPNSSHLLSKENSDSTEKLEGNNSKDVLTEQVKDEGSKATDKTESDVQADAELVLGKTSSASGDSISKEENANDKLLGNSTEPTSPDNQFKDQSDQRAESKDDNNSALSSSGLSLKSKDTNNDHHIPRKKKNPDCRLKKLPNRTLKSIKTKTSLVDKVLPENRIDVLENCNVLTSVKTTNNSALKNDVHGKGNKVEKCKKDKKRTFHGKTETSKMMEKTKQKEDTEAIKDKANKTESTDISQINSTLGDHLTGVPLTVVSEEIVDNSDYKANSIERPNAELGLDEHVQRVEEEKMEEMPEIDEISVSVDTDVKEIISMVDHESGLDVPAENPLDIEPSRTNQEISVISDEPNAKVPTDKPVEDPMEDEHPSDINEQVLLSNQEPDSKPRVDISVDIPVQREHSSEDNGNRHVENNVVEETGNYPKTIPLEEVSKEGNSSTDKAMEISDFNSNSMFQATECKEKYDDNNKNDGMLNEQSQKPVCEDKNAVLDEVDEEIALEERCDDGNVHQFVDSKADNALDKNLQLETEQQVKKHIGEDDFDTTAAVEDTVVESVESQDEKLETVPTSDQEPEEIVKEKGSSLLTEVEKENDSPKSTETEDKGLQNSQELFEHSGSQKKDQLTELKDSVKDNLEIKQICDNDIKVKNTEEAFNECTPAKSANERSNVTMPVNVAPNLSVKKGKRRNNTLSEEEACTEKKSKLSEIRIDVSSGGVQDFSTKSPKLHSPLSTSPRKKDKKSIECIISQLKEEKGNSGEAKEELVKSASSPVVIDVGSLKKKLLQKIKGRNSFKGSQSGEQKSDIVISKDKTVLDSESVHTDTAVVPVESDATEVENRSSIVLTKEFPTTTVISSEVKHNIAEEQADEVPCNEDSASNVQESEMNETENARRETELVEVGNDNVHNSTLAEPVIITNNSVKDNSENSSTTLEESEVSEVRHEHFDSPSVKDTEDEITVKDPPATDKESKEPIFSCTTDISGVFSDDNENKSVIESETSNAIKETSETADSSPLIKPDNTSRQSPVEILSECMPLTVAEQTKHTENSVVIPISSCSLPIDTSKNLKDMDSFDQPKKSFSNSCLEISPNKSIESVNSCVEDFEPANVDSNLLNLCDLMLHVDSVGNVTRRIEESVSSETVCMLSDIISTTISSTNNKLPCVTSATTIKFTFPVTSQADIKDQLIPMNEVDTKKGIFDDSPMSTEKLPPKNGSCLFSLNERMDDSSSRTLSSSSISLNLQEVDFSKIPIDSSQAFDLISPNSMIQTSARNNFINEIPGDNEVSDIMETRSSNTIDHNYTMEPLGGPLLSGRPEEEHIFSSAFNKNLVDSPGEFPLNDNQLPSELSESDDTYKLNLDNEYAVKNLVMLGGQTSDVNSFPLSNYNLSDIERMNLIEDSISNSEDNSNSLDTASLVTSMDHESRDIPSNVTAWTQFITDESSNQKGTVPSCGPRLTSPFSISQNDIIRPVTLTAPCFDEDTLLKESPGAELKMPVKGSLGLKENDPWARFIANENRTQKVVVLPNEQYLTSSFPISQSDFISPRVDNEIILEETSDLNLDNEQTRLETSKDVKKTTGTDVKIEQTNKSNVKRSKKPKKATQKEVPRNDDFLPKRTYSRTVLRAPLKKNVSSSADNGKNPSQNKTTQPNEQPEANLKLKSASTTSFGEKSLPNVASMTTEKDSKQNPKDVPANLPSKRSKLDLTHPSNIFVQNPLETSTPSVIPNNKKSTAVKELKLPTSEAKNLENLPSTILKTKETPSNSAKSFIDTAGKKSDVQSAPELTKQWKDPTKLLTDVSEEKPAQLLIDTTDKIPDVHCNIAELVKFRKRGVNNKYSNNNSPSPAKELRSEAGKSKKIPEKPLTSAPKPELTPQEPKGQHRDQKSPTGHLLLAKSYTPKHEPEGRTPQAQTKPSVKENKLETVIAAENKSHAALPQPCQSKSNHSIESILNKEPKSSTSYLTGGLIKDYKSLKSQGVKRTLTTTGNDGTQKKQIKVNYPEQRQSDNNIDKTFDNLLQQGNVNKLILLRVTEDNKLKPERKYSPSLKPGGSQNASNLPVRSRSKSKELNEATKKEIERRTSLLMKQHGKRDLEAFDKLRMDRGSPSVKLDGRSKEQKEYNKHSWSREGGSGRTKTREDSRSYGSLRSDKGRDQYHSDYNRRREAYYSDHVRGKEGHYSGYGGRRDGHHSNHPRSREHHFEHGSGSVPRSSGSAHPAGGRSSNVSGSYYKSAHVNQGEEQSSHPGSRHSSGPYTKRGATLTEEKQNELLNALRDIVHKQLNNSGLKKSSAEEDNAWIDKLNQFYETPQFIPQPSSPPSDHK